MQEEEEARSQKMQVVELKNANSQSGGQTTTADEIVPVPVLEVIVKGRVKEEALPLTAMTTTETLLVTKRHQPQGHVGILLARMIAVAVASLQGKSHPQGLIERAPCSLQMISVIVNNWRAPDVLHNTSCAPSPLPLSSFYLGYVLLSRLFDSLLLVRSYCRQQI